MESKHTPGPWYAKTSAGGHQGLVASESNGASVAVTYDPADAALVAAAPDMLAACRLASAHFTGMGPPLGESVEAHAERTMRAALAAAIAKALDRT